AGAIDQDEVVDRENQRALKQDIDVGGTIDCWTTNDYILIGSNHPSILYSTELPDDRPMARIRKGRGHYYVTILNYGDDGFQWVKEAIKATGTDRKVERE
ncbi:MAG: hypothetical protein H0T78_00390, partial [Longispora sp.]|nr:hypothetical protein [Longispora sp. (in: high G+C Gram-positive bacteria)]